MKSIPTLGKYHILERLAANELSDICKAKTVGIAGFEKIQVLNRIHSKHASNPQFVNAFIAESKVAFSLNHRNIVQVFEFGKIDRELFVATEHIPGVNLHEVLSKSRLTASSIAVGLACYLMGEVAAGLEYAHSKLDQSGNAIEVIHGGLSPFSIVCSWEGSVKILDYGMAKAAGQTGDLSNLYRGTTRYMSPEQLSGEMIDARSDIFSFGCILWELLSGQPLFRAGSHHALLDQMQRTRIVSPRQFNDEIPEHLETIVLECLQMDRMLRTISASQLQIDLHRIQREVGAVIGSRSLSFFLHEVFPEYSEARDVRQQGSGSIPDIVVDRPSRTIIPDLVDAAAELAEPPNPPAETITVTGAESEDVSDIVHDLFQGSPPSIYHDDESTEAPEPTGPSTSAEAVGVLHSPRPPDEEGSLPPRTWDTTWSRSGPIDDTFSTIASSVRLGRRSQRDETTVPTGETPDIDQSDSQIRQLVEAIQTPSSSEQSDPSIDGHPVDASLDQLHDIMLGTASDDDSFHAHISTQRFREKKRFIAACAMLYGPTELCSAAKNLISDIAYKLEGIVHSNSEDHLVVLFGLPTADENDIVSAVRFALDAIEATSHLRRIPGERSTVDASKDLLDIRVGIRSGSARMIGSPGNSGYTIIGNTLLDTIALAEHATPGRVFISGSAARLASMHYIIREAKAFRHRGKPIRCYRIVAPHGQRPGERASDPLIGREIEMKTLRSTWRQTVLEEQQKSVLISGQAGIGKTRLVDEFLLVHCGDARLIHATATPHRRDTPHATLTDLLKSITGVWRFNSERSRTRLLEKLTSLFATIDKEKRDDLIHSVEGMLLPQDHSVAHFGGDPSRSRVYQVIRTAINVIAQRQPVVLVFEDLHWADSATIDCLAALLNHTQEAAGPTFIIMTVRPGGGLEHRFAARSGPASHIELTELGDTERRQLIAGALGTDPDDKVYRELSKRGGGNPFYLHQLCDALKNVGSSEFSNIPATVQGVLASSVDRLPAQVKIVLQHSAVLGPVFREGILTRMVGRAPTRALSELRRRGILVPNIDLSETPDHEISQSEQFEREWAFRHALLQEMIYESLGTADRRNLHRNIAEIMVKRQKTGSTDPPAEVARHLELGNNPALASLYYLQAAKEATSAHASREALRLFEQALRLSQHDREILWAIYAGRERLYAALGLHREQADDLEMLRHLCGEDNYRIAEYRTRFARRLLRLGEIYQAQEAAIQAQEAARLANHDLLRGEALRLYGETCERLNDHSGALEAVTQALEIFEAQKANAHQVLARIGLGRIMLVQADYEKALQHYAPALELSKKTGDQWQERIVRNNLAVIHVCRGDFSRALNEANYSLRLCQDFGDRAREGDNNSVIGIALLQLGLYEKALRYLERALVIHRDTGSRWSEADALVYAGWLRAEIADYKHAFPLLLEAKNIADKIGARYIAVNALNTMSLALCKRGQTGDYSQALQAAQQAVDLARSASLVVGEIPGLARMARAHRELGEFDEALEISSAAVSLLDRQRHIEGPEEEIYYTHYRITTMLGHDDAYGFLERAHSTLVTKLALMDGPELRSAFTERVALNVAIQRDFAQHARASLAVD